MIWVAIIGGVAGAGFVDTTPNALSLGGSKTTGAAVLDFDRDGDWDLVAPTGGGERLLRNNGLGGWDDLTFELAPDLLSSSSTRGLLAGDLTNDGYPDLVRVERYQLTIFENAGPPSHNFVAGWSFSADGNDLGFEGAALLDADNNGWLDVFFGEASVANWIAFNPGDGTLGFVAVDQAPLGMVTSSNSDFATVGDWDADGDIDVVLRGEGQGPDAFVRDADGWTAVSGFDLNADDNHKGSVTLCDVQGTGALDLFWTSNIEPAVLVFRWDPVRRDWVSAFNGSVGLTGSRSANCGDLDNDGYADLWLADDDGDDILLGPGLDTEPGVDNNNSDDTMASTLADLDGDGDLDVYQIHNGAPNVLLVNDADTDNVLQLSLFANTTTCPEEVVLREDLGAQARVYDLDGGPLTSRLEVSGGMGRGQTAWPVLQFGHVAGDTAVRVEVDFLYGGEGAFFVEVPAGVRQWILVHDDPDGDGIPTELERAWTEPYGDLDADGLYDWADADADGDGIGDREERGPGDRCAELVDSDDDGAPDAYDTDSDGDGISDLPDPNGVDDSDGDGVWDTVDANPSDAGGLMVGAPEPEYGFGCVSAPIPPPGSAGAIARSFPLLFAVILLFSERRRRPGGLR